jgi:hypothetical protein
VSKFVQGVVVSPKVSVVFGPILEAAVAQARHDGRDVDMEILETVDAIADLRESVLAYRAARPEVVGAVVAPVVAPLSSDMVDSVTVPEAARRLKCSKSNITMRLRRGTLPGQKDECDRWWIPATALPAEGAA